MTSLESLRSHFLSEVYEDYREKTIIDPTQKIITRDANAKIKRLVFHCADEEGWPPERLSSFFVYERRFPICAYHYYVTSKVVWHMVGENLVTYHAAPHNSDTVSFSIDYFATRDDINKVALRPELYENAIRTAAFLCMKFHVLPKNVFGHRELFGTGWIKGKNDQPILRKTCPGLAINLDVFRLEVGRRVQNGLNHLYNAGLTVDGVVGPKTVAAYGLLEKY